MCCFSKHVEHVAATQIFARPKRDGRQVLAYSMRFAAREALAMILPIPVPALAAEDAVKFIALDGYEHLFDDVRAAFPPLDLAFAPLARGGPAPAAKPKKLEVHRVGAFEASFVPSAADFARLDPRFRLPPDVFAKMPQYEGRGFAVFKLAAEKSPKTVHPMAFEFPRCDSSSIFFPTVHVHDGEVHPIARFDHTLFCQADGIVGQTLGWTRSNGPLGAKVDELRSRGIVRGDAIGFAQMLFGDRPNRDVVIESPAWSSGDVLRASGDCFEARLRATYAYQQPDEVPQDQRAWCATSRRALDEVFAALRDGVAQLVARKRAAWKLAAYPGAMPEFWPYRYPLSATNDSPHLISFHPFTPKVEPQEVVMSFASAPSADVVAEVERELRGVLARVG
jgi:hypothetical protein